MAARDLLPGWLPLALVISLLVAFLTWFYHHLQRPSPPVAAGYGLYVGAACAAALACSVNGRGGRPAPARGAVNRLFLAQPRSRRRKTVAAIRPTVVGWMDLAAIRRG